MANEFIARKGLIALSDSQITGSLNISQNLNVVGGLTASFDSSTSTAISGAFDSVSSSLASDISLNASSISSLNAASSSYLLNTTDTFTGTLSVNGFLKADSSSTGDYVRLYGSSGTGQWDIYGNGENLRFSENSGGGGSVVVDSSVGIGATTGIDFPLVVQTQSPSTVAIKTIGTASTTGNAGFVGMFADGMRLTSNYYYNGAQAKAVVGNGQAAINLQTGNTAETSYISFATNPPADAAGATERLRIYSDGNVQMQTPGAQFRLQNTVGPAPYLANAGTGNQDLFISTGGEERVRIDSNGRLLVGKQATGYATEGVEIRPNEVLITNDGGTVLSLNRLTSDGTVLSIAQDTTGIANINTNNADIYFDLLQGGNVGIGVTSPGKKLDIAGGINCTDTLTTGGSITVSGTGYREIKIDQTDSSAIRMGVSSGGAEGFILVENTGDNHAAETPKVKILSNTGTVTEYARFTADGLTFNGDTAAANALDDYEEGTWTPTLFSGGTVNSTSTSSGVYCKIGQIVTLRFYVNANITSDGTAIYISGIPFDYPASTFGYSWVAGGSIGGTLFASGDVEPAIIAANTDRIYTVNGNSVSSSTGNYTFEGFVIYMTTA